MGQNDKDGYQIIDEVLMANYHHDVERKRELEMEYMEKAFAPSRVKWSLRKDQDRKSLYAYYFLRGHKGGLKRDRFALWANRSGRLLFFQQNRKFRRLERRMTLMYRRFEQKGQTDQYFQWLFQQ